MATNEFGRAVTPEEAHAYVENYKTFLNTLIADVLTLVPTDAPDAVQQCVTFFKSKANAFIFDAALIKPLFESPDAGQQMVIYTGAAGLLPTVVVAAVKDGANPDLLYLAPKPPPEQAPFLLDAEFANIVPHNRNDIQWR